MYGTVVQKNMLFFLLVILFNHTKVCLFFLDCKILFDLAIFLWTMIFHQGQRIFHQKLSSFITIILLLGENQKWDLTSLFIPYYETPYD